MPFISFKKRLYALSLFIFFIFTSSPCFADLNSETVYLTWQRQPESTMTIQWLSFPEDTNNKVLYRKPGETLWTTVEGFHLPLSRNPALILHRVELTQLTSDTDYEFKLALVDQRYLFRTMPNHSLDPISFVVGGDMYHDDISLMKETCRQAALMHPRFALIGGDIAYAVRQMRSKENISRWIEWIKAWNETMVTPEGRMIPVIVAIGNHDIIGQFNQTPKQAKVFSTLFPMPGEQLYQVLDFSNYMSFFLLDSGHGNAVRGTQTTWLKNALNQRQHIDHRFAIYHVPAYPSIHPYNSWRSAAIRRHWVPLFEKGNVDVVFENHDHAYKRTAPLINSKYHPDGVLYVGDGGWGVKEPRKPRSRRKFDYFDQLTSTRNFIWVILQADQLMFQVLDEKGQIIDEFGKDKSSPYPNDFPSNLERNQL